MTVNDWLITVFSSSVVAAVISACIGQLGAYFVAYKNREYTDIKNTLDDLKKVRENIIKNYFLEPGAVNLSKDKEVLEFLSNNNSIVNPIYREFEYCKIYFTDEFNDKFEIDYQSINLKQLDIKSLKGNNLLTRVKSISESQIELVKTLTDELHNEIKRLKPRKMRVKLHEFIRYFFKKIKYRISI